MKRLAVLPLLFAVRMTLAQPYLVKDITTAGAVDGASRPENFLVNGPALFFTTGTSELRGLWKSDGTANGTRMLHRGYAGSLTTFGSGVAFTDGGAIWISDGTPDGTRRIGGDATAAGPILELHGKLFFEHYESATGYELWATDGTAAGTAMVADLTPGSSSTLPTILGLFNDRLVFASSRGIGITDGTSGGTTMLATLSAPVDSIVVAGEHFFFRGPSAKDSSGRELWVSDGTAAGTRQVAQIFPDRSAFSLYEQSIVPIGNRVVFFTGSSRNVWVSDGSAAGTVRLGDADGYSSLVLFDGAAWFVRSDGLWRTDGTSVRPAVAIKNIVNISAAAGRLWISVSDGSCCHRDLWTSDGTSGSARLLTHASPLMPAAALGGRAFFSADDGDHGFEPWSSDGTPEGTAMLLDIGPNVAPSSNPQLIGAAGTHVVFGVFDGGKFRGWSSDGTPEGTFPLFDAPAPPRRAARFHGFLYFTKQGLKFSPIDNEVWRTDGTAAGTELLVAAKGEIDSLTVVGDLLYITGSYDSYISDGTPGGTVTASVGLGYGGPPVFAGRALFVTGFSGDTYMLWDSDGKETRPIVTLPGRSGLLACAGGTIYLFVGVGTHYELWKTDGTAEGLVRLRELRGYASLLATTQTRIFFTADDGIHGTELWTSDGTAEGTMLVKDINPGAASSSIAKAAVLDERIVFAADDGVFGSEPWVSDGTAAGTRMLADIAPLGASSEIDALTAVRGVAFFSAYDPLHGAELWRTDGTPQGTQLVADIEPGPLSSKPALFTAAGDLLFFAATTVAAGRELYAMPIEWRTISINDVRVKETAGSATLTVSLDAPSRDPVTAALRGAGTGGSLVFEPGQTQKTITLSVARDPQSDVNHFRNVSLFNVVGAVPTKSLGKVLVENVDGSADLAVSVAGSKLADVFHYDVVVKNLGPSTVPLVTLRFSGQYSYSSSLPTLRPGESASYSVNQNDERFGVTATSSLPDPNAENNSATLQLSPASWWLKVTLRVGITPMALAVGTHARLLINSLTPRTVQLTSSNPAVLALPPALTVPAGVTELDVVALSAGTTTIAAAEGKDSAAMTIDVQPAGSRYRWPATLDFRIADGSLVFGTVRELRARVTGIAYDFGPPLTGSVTFAADGMLFATAPLDRNGEAKAVIDWLLPGDHVLTAAYSGDAAFVPRSATASVHIHPPLGPTFTGTLAPHPDGTATMTIIVDAVAGILPTGTITVARAPFHTVIAENARLADGRATFAVSPPLSPTVTVEYSGDSFYPPSVRSIPLGPPPRQRASH